MAARMDLEKYLSRGEYKKFVEVSAATSCRVCGGVVVLSLTDLDQNLIPYVELRKWFFQLHMAQMQCVGKDDHIEPQGWGYYWNLDQILKRVYPGEYHVDTKERGRPQFFGVDVQGTEPRVHILRTRGPLVSDVIRRSRPQAKVNFLV